MISKRLVSLVLCFTLILGCFPIFSICSSASNSGFVQIRVYYKIAVNGVYGDEQSAIITEDGCLQLASTGANKSIQITRFLIRNEGGGTGYFSFDINAGGLVPPTGTHPFISYSSLLFTANGGVTAYSFASTDHSDFAYINGVHGSDPQEPGYDIINCPFSRTFFGKVQNNGYITFNNPVTLNFKQNDSLSPYSYLFFRHVIVGYDNSNYLANMEQYLAGIESNTYAISQDVGEINDWMAEEKDLFDNSWNSGAGSTYQEYSSDNRSFFGSLRDLFGFSLFGGLWTLDVFQTSNNLFSAWFSQSNSDDINGPDRRSNPLETEYIDFYSKNINGELDIFGIGGSTQ